MKAGIDYIGVSVGAMIVNNEGSILLCKRSKKARNETSCWEVPGGQVEFGERLEEAVKREMKEELNIKVKRMKFIKKDFWTASNGEKQKLYYYLISEYEGKPICKTAKELLWTENINDLDTDVDRKVIEFLNR